MKVYNLGDKSFETDFKNMPDGTPVNAVWSFDQICQELMG